MKRWLLLVSSLGILWNSPVLSQPAASTSGSQREQSTEPPSEQKSQVKTVSPPGYKNLRYQEDWSFLGEQTGSDFWTPLKFVSLSDSKDLNVSFGGQIRGRTEFWSNFGFGAADTNDDTFDLLRVRLHGDLHLGPHARFFAEGKSALATRRELPGGLRTLDVDTIALQNAFIDLSLPLVNDAMLTFRAGRQELQFGKQRLVSPLDWANTRRTFDGFRGILNLQSWRVDGFWSRFVGVRKYAFNRHDSDIDFFGLYGSGPLPGHDLTLDLYWLGIDRKSVPSAGQKRHTIGSRLAGRLAQRSFDFDLEASYQFGDFGDQDVEAFMFASQLGYTFTSVKTRLRLYLGFDYASGDDDPSDNKVQTFDQLFPLAHAYLGFIDIVGRQNIVDFNQEFSFQIVPRMRLGIDSHFFWRANANDALYNAGGGVVRAGDSGDSKRVGSEIDLTWRYGFNRHTLLVIGYSHFFAGKFISQSGSDKNIDFGYIDLAP